MAGEHVFGALLDAALELDRGWMDYGSCRAWADKFRHDNPTYRGPTLWHVASTDQAVGDIPAHKVVDMALLICAGCMVRYDCARFAVEGRMRAGTWAMRIKLLDWLQTQKDALDIVRAAEEANVNVQVFVRDTKRARTGK